MRENKYYSPSLYDRGYKTVEVRMMDSNFDLEKRIIPYINEIIKIKDSVKIDEKFPLQSAPMGLQFAQI